MASNVAINASRVNGGLTQAGMNDAAMGADSSLATVVHVPHPARFALHKLIVYGERSGTFVSKAGKDLLQAACLLSFLLEQREWEVEEAFEDMVGRGKSRTSRAKRGLDALKNCQSRRYCRHGWRCNQQVYPGY